MHSNNRARRFHNMAATLRHKRLSKGYFKVVRFSRRYSTIVFDRVTMPNSPFCMQLVKRASASSQAD